MTILHKALGGVAWSYSGFLGERVLGLVATAVLARLLAPSDFGVLAFALLVVGAIETLRDLGIKDALIRDPERSEAAIRTAAWMGLAIGLAQGALAVLAAPLAGQIIGDPRAVPVIQVLALSFVINGAALVPDALLQRRLRFRTRSLGDFGAACVKAVATLGLAFAGLELWAIVVGHLVGATARALMRYRAAAWHPRLAFHPACARALWAFGRHVLVANMAHVVLARADQIAIAVLLGPASLGYYYIGARLPELTIAGLSLVLTTVLFPTYSVIQHDVAALRSAFCTAVSGTALVAVPIGAGLIAVAPELVAVLFGGKWVASVPILRVLATVALVYALAWSAGDVFKALGRPQLQTRIIALDAAVAVPVIAGLTYFTGAAYMAAFGALAGAAASTAMRLWLVGRLLALVPRELVRLYAGPLAGGAAIGLAVSAFRHSAAGAPPWLVLAGSVILGVCVYAAVIWRVDFPALSRLGALISGRGKSETGRLAGAEVK